ncbi:hypothetical protein AKJ62_04200 [candidate division MSBL1 archaeon SCGC-AAA259D14]|uniref:Uncharacterized protein n=2 Tax=candidate division MSBL1 TaxID=215777 RepID=A0A133UTH8_9EURY|nr:hypothetical protein AKJ62_04200 [candidate division MSBL1 archaeon SCGC-AAA259D14]KXA97515.1 hypothetical protein AKJ38_00960 [candidate division MSBL1 archaeon SCGC-AAA259I14]
MKKGFFYLIMIVIGFTLLRLTSAVYLGKSVDLVLLAAGDAIIIAVGYAFLVREELRDFFKETSFTKKFGAHRTPDTARGKFLFLVGALGSPTAGLAGAYLMSGYLDKIGIFWLRGVLGLLSFFGITVFGLILTVELLGLSEEKKNKNDGGKARKNETRSYRTTKYN